MHFGHTPCKIAPAFRCGRPMRSQAGRPAQVLLEYHCIMTDNNQILGQALKFCGEARFNRYLDDAEGDINTALALCKWNHEFAGVLHEQIGYVEVCVRNAIDRELRIMSRAQTGDSCWTNLEHAPEIVAKLLSRQIREARSAAKVSLDATVQITHDDILSKLMWGTWVKIVGLPEASEKTDLQQELWSTSLYRAFPNVSAGEEGRQKIAGNLGYLRIVRNKAAHFDNLYDAADHRKRVVNASLSLLTSIDKDFGRGWLNISRFRTAAKKKQELLPASCNPTI